MAQTLEKWGVVAGYVHRQTAHITNKKMVRQNGQRLIAYEIPAP